MNINIHHRTLTTEYAAVFLALAVLCSSCTSTSSLITGPELPPLTGTPAGDYVRLDGSWIVTYNERNKVALTEMTGATFQFKGNRHRISGDRSFEWFAVDSSRSPKTIDFYDNRSPTIRGIYELNGSELVLCTAAPGKPRPTKFETSPFSGTVLTKTRRER
jgi:uncharacterized protein (TIGR03067 family)